MGSAQIRFELRFSSLAGGSTTYAFPCDRAGSVDMDSLGDRERLDYLFARGSIGYAFGFPAVVATMDH